MSRDTRDPGQSPERPTPPPAAGEFDSLFAQLESAEPASPANASDQPLGSWLTNALGAVPEPQTRARDLDFERHQAELLARGKARNQPRPTAAPTASNQPQAAVSAQKSAVRGAVPAARPGTATPERQARSPRSSTPAIAPVANTVANPAANPVAGPVAGPVASTRPAEPAADEWTPSPAADTAVQEFELLHRISLELARYPALAGLALQFSAAQGHVTVVGDLRSEYERQLVKHFVKSVRGVTELTDLTRVPSAVVPATQPAASTSPAPRRRSSPRGAGVSWSLPPQAKSMAAIALTMLLAWTGYSFAKRGDGLPKVYPARGQVLLPGLPLEGALLVLHPTQAGSTARPRATLRDDGRFELTTHATGDGAPEGEYVVTAILHQLQEVDGEPVPGPNQLPPLFAKPETSPLRVTIQRGSNDLPPLRLSP